MNRNEVYDRTIVLGGPLLSLDEAIAFTKISQESLLKNVRGRCCPVHVAKRVYFFEDELRLLVTKRKGFL